MVQNCIVQVQHETALSITNISIMFPVAVALRPGIDHGIHSVISSPRR
ncbi:hypothetical protein [Bradyrhizobium manausense]|nr:hypothetical protein [Bradyrhizobium manausense]